jgi:hypothetical protein
MITNLPLKADTDILLRFIVLNREIKVPGTIAYKNTYSCNKNRRMFKYGIRYAIPTQGEKQLLENILKKLSLKSVKQRSLQNLNRDV